MVPSLSHKKLSVFLIFIVLISYFANAAPVTAVATADWSVGTTWSSGVVPTNADDVVIPTGITVTVPTGSNLNATTWKSIEVSGTLSVVDNLVFNDWNPDSVVVKNGGVVNIGQDLNFQTGNAAMYVKVYEGGKINVGSDILDGGSNARFIYNYGTIEVAGNYNTDCHLYNYDTGVFLLHGNMLDGATIRVHNYGYIEVDLDINHNGIVYNYNGGLVLVHGTVSGSASLNFHNYGVVTIDGSLNMVKTHMFNYSTGMLITFGEIYIGEGSELVNSGLVQCVDFRYANNTAGTGLNNTGGTLIVQETITVEGSNCPGCSTYLGTLYYGDIVSASGTCSGYASCSAFLSGGTQITQGRRLWLNASFIGYGLQANNNRIYQWFDLANYYGFKMSQLTTANRPYIKNNSTDNLNFNPVISFEGAALNMDMDASTLFGTKANNGMGFFAVVVPKTTATQSVFDYGLYPTDGYGLQYDIDNVNLYTPTNHGGAENASAHTNGTKPTIVSQTTTWLNNQSLYMNGTLVVTNSVASLDSIGTFEVAESNPSVLNTSGPFTIGGKSVNPVANDFEGKLAELIIYAKDVDVTTRKATESFLALKYGINLPYNYTDYTGNTIYTLDGTYDNSIFGLGRQDLNHLHQRQSKSSESGNNLTLATNDVVAYDQREVATQIAKDKSFIVCGHNGNSMNDGTRVYKITTTNFNQAVKLQFRFTGIDVPYPSLTIDDNSTFTNAPVTIPYTSYDGNNLVFDYTFPNNATRYFKVGGVVIIPRAPGVGINTTVIDTSAQLQINSTTRGVLIPNVDNSQMGLIASPPTGLLIYNTDQDRYMYNVGTPATPQWVNIGRFKTDTNAGLTASTGSYLGEIRYNTTDNKLWYWNGTKWRELLDN